MEPKTILLIEDNALNIKLVEAILRTQDHKVLVAKSAEDGIDLARSHSCDLILMDIQLPGMDGLEATRLIKADSDLKDVPVIALTSYAMKDDRKDSIAAGCDEYITKPIDSAEFWQKISIFLE